MKPLSCCQNALLDPEPKVIQAFLDPQSRSYTIHSSLMVHYLIELLGSHSSKASGQLNTLLDPKLHLALSQDALVYQTLQRRNPDGFDPDRCGWSLIPEPQ